MDIYKKYKNAEKLLSQNTEDSVLNGDIKVNWIDEEEFWYLREVMEEDIKGKYFTIVNCIDGSKKDAFAHEKLAKNLNEIIGSNYKSYTLPFSTFEYTYNRIGIKFKVEDFYYEYNFSSDILIKTGNLSTIKDDESLSPDKGYTTFVKNNNLYIKKLDNGEITQLTYDGILHYNYGSYPGSNNITVHDRIKNIKKKPGAIWSPDSKKILTYKLDEREVKELHVIQSVTEDEENLRPKLFSYRYHLPGDEHIPKAYMYICDIENKTCTEIDTDPLYINFTSPYTEDYKKANWLKDGSKVYFTRLSRDFKEAEFKILDTTTLEVKTVIKEKSDTFLFYDSFSSGDGYDDYGFSNRLLEDGKHIIWQSERDGWAHFYLYDAETGELINQITKGEWSVRNLAHIDEKEEWMYFTAGGREEGRDPYYLHFYRVKLDGTELELLTPEDANHSISLSPNKDYFVDTYSRVDLPPKTVLRAIDGTLITTIEEANIDKLLQIGYILPERFVVKASDGITDLHGIMIKPANFDETKQYPLIDYIYGGPQTINTPKSFTWKGYEGSSYLGGLQSFAQLGFLGIIMDGLGTPQRSKKIHDYCYKNLEGCAGLEDHFICTQELGKRFNFIDIERIGLWGASGGGYATVRAMLEYPHFYKVGVAASGNHDQRLYNAAWVERYNGLFDKEVYLKQDNTKLAKNLKGKLLLVHGDLDDNVHISQTIRLVDALIKENKDFDFIILPNYFHSVSGNKYFVRRMWDHFVKNLLGVEPPKEYKIN